MFVTERNTLNNSPDLNIIFQNEDCTVYKIADHTGDIIMTSYSVFPGIHLIYNDAHMQRCSAERMISGNVIEINHCREGRIECEFKDEFCYLSQGDLAIARKDETAHDSYFPLKHYHGISITIDIDRAPDCLSCLLDDVNVKPSALIRKFCSTTRCFILRSKPCLEHIFSELYSVPDSIKKGYFKVKILELLLFLNGMELEKDDVKRRFYSKTQVTLAKNTCKYLTKHMDSRITLEQLTDIFHVSGTQLKNSFKGVYGVSVYSYIRTQKMQAAALTLRQTNDTVLEIAGKYGYENGSKFASAFRDVIGVSPSKYRSQTVRSEPNSAQMEWTV
ncbi:MAG: AraC family transcriptional regulator [Oscillospiraceae bacterium]|jgi:AraC-like DNA-binding protein|nr:AraC family transcriptional regulator [Oscillospiraceae bacterium]